MHQQSCGLCMGIAAWCVITRYRRRTSADRLIQACGYSRRYGVFTVGLATALWERRWVVRKHTEASGGIYEHFAESENGEALVQGSLDWRRVWGIGRSHPNPVLGLESRFTLRFISIRRWIVGLCGALDLHPD